MAKRVQKKKNLIFRLQNVLIFLLVFNLLSVPLYAAVYTGFSYKPLQELNAKLLHSTLKLFGYDAELSGIMINLMLEEGLKKIEISWDSTGWKSMYAIAALIIATPTSTIYKRLKFAGIGVAIIFALNYLRIATTILVSANFGFHLFDVTHNVLWREGLIISVVLIWFIWLKMEKYNIRGSLIRFR